MIFESLLFLSILFFPSENYNNAHALYISVIEINHSPTDSTAEIKIKVFKDDLQNALRNAFPNNKIPNQELVCENHLEISQQYFSKYFKCSINEELVDFQLKNCEKNNEAYWLIFEIKCPKNWKTVRVKANFFMELFPTQSNIIHLTEGEEKKFARLTKGNEEILFSH